MPCTSPCFEAIIPSCTDIILDVGLPANTAFAVTVEKVGKNRVQQRQLSTNDDGKLVIDRAEHFPGFFAFGHYKLHIQKVDDYPTPQPMEIQGNTYTCLLIKVGTLAVHDGDTTPVNVIR